MEWLKLNYSIVEDYTVAGNSLEDIFRATVRQQNEIHTKRRLSFRDKLEEKLARHNIIKIIVLLNFRYKRKRNDV